VKREVTRGVIAVAAKGFAQFFGDGVVVSAEALDTDFDLGPMKRGVIALAAWLMTSDNHDWAYVFRIPEKFGKSAVVVAFWGKVKVPWELWLLGLGSVVGQPLAEARDQSFEAAADVLFSQSGAVDYLGEQAARRVAKWLKGQHS